MTHIIGDIDDLAEEIHRIARSQAKDEETKAERQANTIIEEARNQADELQDEILSEARKKAEQVRKRKLAQADQQTRRKKLTMREEYLQQVWDQAEERLRQLVDEQGYVDVLRQLAWLGVETLGGGPLSLASDPRGHELLSEDLLEDWSSQAGEAFDETVEFSRSPDPMDTWGGLVATRKGGRERMDARFTARLQEARVELRDEIFNILVGSDG